MAKMPQHLSAPYQLLWFEPDDISIIMIGYLLSVIFHEMVWFIFLIIPATYLNRRNKRRYPKGFLKHLLYIIGWSKLKGYPHFFEEEFIE